MESEFASADEMVWRGEVWLRWSQTDTEDADEAFTRSFSVAGSIAILMKIFIILICKHYVFETKLLINHLIATFSLRVVSK